MSEKIYEKKRTIKNKINKINAYFEKFGNSILNYICIKPYRYKVKITNLPSL